MNVLEKILEEIEEKFKTADAEKFDCEELCDVEDWYDSGYIDGQLSAHEKCMDIIRSHMGDGKGTNVLSDDGWIPVEERLPEEGERCIVADKCGYVHDGIIYDYADSKDDKLSFHKWDDEYWQCFRPDVIAWQPLPEPYKPK